jgi:hypothetical protein
MRARRIIDGASFGPDVLKVLRQAFDEAWAEVELKFSPAEHETAREILAESMMSMTRDDSSDVGMLRRAGVRAMALAYPARFGNPSGQNGTDG